MRANQLAATSLLLQTLEMSSWENLSNHIGYLILDMLPEVVEHIRFGVVCKRWHSIAREYHKSEKGKRRPLPMLLVPPNTITGTKPNLYALSCRGNHYRNLNLPLSYAYRYCGSSHGWLATQNPDCSVTLEHPFGEKVSYIHLPVLDARFHRSLFPAFTIRRLIISPTSTQDDYTVVAIYGGQREIATIKSGEESWFLIKPAHEDRDRGTGYSDIIFHKGLVYAVNSRHGIVAFDVSIRPPKVVRLLSNFERLTRYDFYLVESTQMDLLLVGRHIGEKTKDEGEYNDEEYNEEEYDDEGVVEQYDAEEYLEDYEGSSYDDSSDEENIEEEDDREEDGEEEEEGDNDMEEEQNRDLPIKLTLRFKVYKLKTDGLSGKIIGKIEVENLNGDALFVGDNMSFSFPAASYPGCEPDTIYFSDDFYYGDYFEPDGSDVGSFNMVKKSFEKHYIQKSTHKHMPPATWIFPPFPIYD